MFGQTTAKCPLWTNSVSFLSLSCFSRDAICGSLPAQCHSQLVLSILTLPHCRTAVFPCRCRAGWQWVGYSWDTVFPRFERMMAERTACFCVALSTYLWLSFTAYLSPNCSKFPHFPHFSSKWQKGVCGMLVWGIWPLQHWLLSSGC